MPRVERSTSSAQRLLLLAAVTALSVSTATAFVVHPDGTSRPAPLFYSDSETEGETTVSKAELRFVGKFQTSSEPLPYKSKKDVMGFFQCPNNRNMFVTAGGKRECDAVEMTETILENWTRLCAAEEGCVLPIATDEVFTVKTGEVHFPGLTLVTSATMGMKLVEQKSSHPTYQVTMIGDDRQVTGLRPVVFLFNKLTGGNSGSANNTSTTHIICDFTSKNEVIFRTDTEITIRVKFPAMLMKLLPISKEKAEEEGSQSISKAVSKDVAESMRSFEEAYRLKFDC